ncbi:MAG: hypothetical protein AAGJ95_10175 [Cyanobacteria bacterium J06554_11]
MIDLAGRDRMDWLDYVALCHDLGQALAFATECELATVERLNTLAKPPKSQLARHSDIADKLVQQCFALGVEPVGIGKKSCGRLERRLEELKKINAEGSKEFKENHV